ncbi:MAG TPA: hypothetical protein VGM62_12125 [Chthoniobacterales bacterium]|jgi:hypothetical protein
MRKISVLFFLFVTSLVFADPALRPGINTDDQLSAKLIGTWRFYDPSSSSDTTFSNDGTARGTIEYYDEQGNSAFRVDFISEWKVENGQLIARVSESNKPDRLPIGSRFADTILYVSDDRFVFLSGDLRVKKVMVRNPPIVQ